MFNRDLNTFLFESLKNLTMEQDIKIIKLKCVTKILLYYVISLYSETYLGPFQISMKELFAKVVK